MTTASGLPVQVAPMPSGMTITISDLARRAGYADGRALLAAISEDGAPALPPTFRMGGAQHIASDLASDFLREVEAFKASEPERKARAQQRERDRRDAAYAARRARDDAEMAAGAEFRAMVRANEARREAEAEAAKTVREPIIIGSDGRLYK